MITKVISDTQGWRRVMAYIDPPGEAWGRHCKVHSRGMTTAGPVPALTSVMTPAAAAALMMWWRQ